MPELERSCNLVWLRAVHNLRSWTSRKPHLLGFGATTVLGAVLLTPSIWMLSAIPPLWRNVDAYFQVTQPPGPATILQWGPLYCFVARIPLYFGYAIDCVRAGASFPTPAFFIHPILTDSGVFLILLSQHEIVQRALRLPGDEAVGGIVTHKIRTGQARRNRERGF